MTEALTIRVSRADTGEVLQELTIENDYCVVVAGNRYLMSTYAVGPPDRLTHTIHVGTRREDEPRAARWQDYLDARNEHAWLLRAEGLKFKEIAPRLGVTTDGARGLVYRMGRRVSRATRRMRVRVENSPDPGKIS